MKQKIMLIIIFGIFFSACTVPNQIAYEYKEILKSKIAQYAIENVQSNFSDDEYFSGLWEEIEQDALKYYQVEYPYKSHDYYKAEINQYRERLRNQIFWLREELRRQLIA